MALKRLETAFSKSNLYGVLHGFYHEIAVFGTAAFLLEENFETGVRARLFTAGEYVLGVDDKGTVNTFGREFSMRPKQLMRHFGTAVLPPAIKREAAEGKARSLQMKYAPGPRGACIYRPGQVP